MDDQLKFLLIDIELSYAIYRAFPSKKPQYLSSKQIVHQQFCPCASWKWLNEVSVYSIKITDDMDRWRDNFRDDYIVAKALHDKMTEADVIIAHNGDSFDIKHANTLFRKHHLGPIPQRKSIDTLKVARKYFAFAGNDLDGLSKLFGGPGKNTKPNWDLLTDGDYDETNTASTYCANDIIFNYLGTSLSEY